MEKRVKLAFVLTDVFVPAWYSATISMVLSAGNTDIYFLHLPPANAGPPASLLYRCFTAFEEKWFKSEYDASRRVSVEDVIKEYPYLKLNKSAGYMLHADDLAMLKDLDLDLIYTIDFSSRSPETLSEASRFGLWYVHFGFGNYNNSIIPALWEVMDESPVTGSYLLMRKGNNDYILYEGTTPSVPYSVKNNFNSIAWKSNSFLPYRLATLRQLYDTFFQYFPNTYSRNAGVRPVPGNGQMGFLFIRNVLRYLNYKLKMNSDEGKFTILYATRPFNFEVFNKQDFKVIDLPPEKFFADPFVVANDNMHYIFFEEYVYSTGKAHISLITMDDKGNQSPPTVILEKSYHLSYPFVFDINGEYYMIPETAANKTVELYKAVDFPANWEFVMNLMEGMELIDCTVLLKDGTWWLFANSSNHPFVSTNDQLFLYYSNDLFSTEWKAHPMNPIATHAESCRPAGRIFQKGNKIFRPAQNNASQQYGYGIVVNEIVVINESEYVEKPVFSINPACLGLRAVHNIDFTSKLVVIDGIPT